MIGTHASADEFIRKTAASRDGRIDFFRGVALLCIFIDHIPGNFVSRLTLHNLGFSDAAELFVLLAGVSSALAYGRRKDATRLILKRVGRIYLAHISLVFMVAAALALSVYLSGSAVLAAHATLLPFEANFYFAAARTMILSLQPEFIDILPLYLVLLLWLLVILRLAHISAGLAFAVSFLIWLLAAQFQINLAGDRNGGWFFNPFAWQFVYSIGVLIGLRKSNAGRTDTQLPKSRMLLIAAMLYLGFAFILYEPWAQFPIAELRQFHILPADLIGKVSKTYDSGWRIAHVLCLAYVTAWFVPQSAEWLGHGWAMRVRQLGRLPLVMFILASLFSYVASIAFVVYGKSIAIQLTCNIIGLATLIGMGTTAEFFQRKRPRRDKPIERLRGAGGIMTVAN